MLLRYAYDCREAQPKLVCCLCANLPKSHGYRQPYAASAVRYADLAKELGAMIFTYKGEDIADTILHFAREYRVGHIVMGSPSHIPFWKRIMARRAFRNS